MRAAFNCTINVQSSTVGNEDSNGNLTYTYNNVLVNEGARKFETTRNKLTDDNLLLINKVTSFMIFDVDTDLSTAVNIVCDNKNYVIDRIVNPDSFSRVKYRVIETHLKESDN